MSQNLSSAAVVIGTLRVKQHLLNYRIETKNFTKHHIWFPFEVVQRFLFHAMVTKRKNLKPWQNSWTDLKLIRHKWSLGDSLPRLFKLYKSVTKMGNPLVCPSVCIPSSIDQISLILGLKTRFILSWRDI